MRAMLESSRSPHGVTLIELMIVIVVVGILATITLSSYRRYVVHANRIDATSTLLRIQVAQEKYFLNNNQYVQTLANVAAAPPTGLGIGIDGSTGATTDRYYMISLSNTSATTYTATATAANGQISDSSTCRTLSIDQSGARTPPESSGCWR